nr:transposase [Actinoplanes solisilvae]
MSGRLKGGPDRGKPGGPGKPGSKIHVVSDRNGLPLTVVVSAANVNDSTMLENVLDNLRAIRQPLGRPRRWPGKLHGDKGYDYRFCREVVRRRGMIARIARKGIEPATHLGRHRYVIERCLEWVSRFRAWPAATTARLPTSPASCAWPAL